MFCSQWTLPISLGYYQSTPPNPVSLIHSLGISWHLIQCVRLKLHWPIREVGFVALAVIWSLVWTADCISLSALLSVNSPSPQYCAQPAVIQFVYSCYSQPVATAGIQLLRTACIYSRYTAGIHCLQLQRVNSGCTVCSYS